MSIYLSGRVGQIEQTFPAGQEIISTIIKPKVKKYTSDLQGLIKIGIIADPGTVLKINGEKIRISKTGIYELDNIVLVKTLEFEEETQALIDYVF